MPDLSEKLAGAKVGSRPVRWAERQRMQFIGALVCSIGAINRRDITDRFGVSVTQASNDLRRFQQELPGMMRYDATRKAYVLVNVPAGRDDVAAARTLAAADDAWLAEVAHRDPDMIRDVAKALLRAKDTSDAR